ncbi:radical SAM protein [Saccharopolyspora karakumensis]|uniref:radical SAM protein n=1 Tax=Saccharopolyspora karakumensis TaxID=2530386 RepID=UPI001F2DEA0E|nr:radical SAM protein [Saccharopolyspora karakumensis]
MWLEITGRCQLECRHCYAESGPAGDHGGMTDTDWRRVIDEAAEAGVKMVQFIGGEPTLHPSLPALIDHTRTRGIEVEVFSNLVHVRLALWEVFAQPGVRLATSYYSTDAAEHAQITKRQTYARTKAQPATAPTLPNPVGMQPPLPAS